MVQADTSGELAAEPEAAAADPPPSWFTYEGPKISFAATIGASKEMTLLGFQAATKISHNQSISWSPASAEVKGPLLTEAEINGPKKKVSMNLGASLELAPGALIHRARERAKARGVDVKTNGGETVDDKVDAQAQVTEVQSDVVDNQVGAGLNANAGNVET